MGSTSGKETCGRCSTSTVVEAVTDEDADHDPLEGGHIEVDERELRLASAHAVAFGRIKRRIDEFGKRLIYGR